VPSALRVLTLVDAFRFGGAEILLSHLAAAGRDVDIELEIVSVSPATINADETMTLLRAAGVQPRNLNVRRLLDPTAIPQLVAEIRRSDCDIVHAHLEMAMTLALPAAKLARRPLVCTFHHLASPLTGRPAKRERLAVAAASHSDRAIFVCEASRSAFHHQYGYRKLPSNWEVVHNGVDLCNFTPGAPDPQVRAHLGGGDGPLVVIPGAFRDCKGIPVGIASWTLVREKFPDAVLCLVGDGPPAAEYKALVAAAGLRDSVVFAGSRTDMPDVYRAADIVLAPALPGENFPTTLIEASATARPIVTTSAGGIPEIVLAEETGLIVEPRNPSAVAAAVCRLLENPELGSKLGHAAMRRARENFSAHAFASNMRKVYLSALEGSR
jgi:glycosyltransferase involved in cell wall biosynthesis